jgi:hypothetical protein
MVYLLPVALLGIGLGVFAFSYVVIFKMVGVVARERGVSPLSIYPGPLDLKSVIKEYISITGDERLPAMCMPIIFVGTFLALGGLLMLLSRLDAAGFLPRNHR